MEGEIERQQLPLPPVGAPLPFRLDCRRSSSADAVFFRFGVVIAELDTHLALYRGRCFQFAARIHELEGELEAALALRGPVTGGSPPQPPVVD